MQEPKTGDWNQEEVHMSTSLYNYGPLPNAELIARVIEYTRQINQAYIDAIDERKSRSAERVTLGSQGTANASNGADASNTTETQKGKGIVA